MRRAGGTLKLFIAIPSNRGWSAWFGDSFSRLVKGLALGGVDFEIDCLFNSSCLSRARSGAVNSCLPEEPLFSMPWNGSDYLGEDVFFFMRLEEAGVPVFVDHDLSNQIAHVGEYGYHFPCKK